MSLLKKKSTIIYAIIILAISLGVSCSDNQQEHAPLKIGHAPWPGFDIILYAELAELFSKRQLEVELIAFEHQFDVSRALMRGRLDAGFTSVSDLISLQSDADPAQIILATNISHGSDGIVSTASITDVKSLSGKRVSAKKSSVNEIILYEALNLHGLALADLNLVDVSNEVAFEKFLNKELDAAVLWEPQLSEAANKVNGNIIFRTDEVESLVIDVLAASDTAIEKRSEDLRKFLLAWLDIMQAIDDDPDKVFSIVGPALGQTAAEFKNDYSGLKKGDAVLNKKMFGAENLLLNSRSHYMDYLEQAGHNNPEQTNIHIHASLIINAIDQHRHNSAH